MSLSPYSLRWFQGLIMTCHCICVFMLLLLSFLHKNRSAARAGVLSCSPLESQHLEQCLQHKKYSRNICSMNISVSKWMLYEWMNQSKSSSFIFNLRKHDLSNLYLSMCIFVYCITFGSSKNHIEIWLFLYLMIIPTGNQFNSEKIPPSIFFYNSISFTKLFWFRHIYLSVSQCLVYNLIVVLIAEF